MSSQKKVILCDTVHQHYVNLSLEEKRRLYSCGDNFVTLDQIPTWDKELRKSVPVGKYTILDLKYKLIHEIKLM